MNDPAMDRALALVRAGRSFQEASDATGTDVQALMGRWYGVSEPALPFIADDDDAQP